MPRELRKGRVERWADRMSEKKTLADGSQVDMADPVSIRRYVRHALAMSEPTIAGLKRLEMLQELATQLEAEKKSSSGNSEGPVRLVRDSDVDDELRKRGVMK